MRFDALAPSFALTAWSCRRRKTPPSTSAPEDMSIEKIFGRAAYAFLARVGKNIMFADDSQETLFMGSEAHH